MAQVEGNVKVNVNANQAVRQLELLDQKASELRQEIIKISKQKIVDSKQVSLLEKELKAVQKQQLKLKKSAVNYQSVLKNLSGASLRDLQKAKRQLNYEVNNLTRNTKEWKLKAENLEKIKAEITSVRQKMRSLNTTTKKTQGFFGRMADGFNKFGGIALSVIAGISLSIAGLRQVFQKLSSILTDFEDSFTNVLTLLSAEQIDEFGESLETGAIDTIKKFGLEVKDVNKALFDTVSAGVDASEAIDVLDAAGILATAGTTNLSIATDGLTTIINAYGLSTEEATNISNAFFSAQKFGKTTVEELANNYGKLAPMLANVNIGYQEGLSMLAEMTKQGISTAESTTYLKSMFKSLIKPTAEAEKVLREFNVPVGVSEIQTAGLTNTLEALNNMIAQNPNAVAKAIPSVEGMTAAFALSGDSLTDFTNILGEVNTDIGDTSSMMGAFATKTEIMSFKIAQAKAKLAGVVIELKEKLAPIVLTVVSLITKFSNGLRNLAIEFFKTGSEQQGWVIILKEIGNLIKALVTGIIAPFITALKEIFFNTNKNNIITQTLIITLRLLIDIVKAVAIPLAALVKFVTDIVISLGEFNKATSVLNTNLDNAVKKTDEYGNIVEENTDYLDKYGNKIEYVNSMIKENTLLIDENGNILNSKLPVYDKHGEVLSNISVKIDETNGKIKISTPLFDEFGNKIKDTNVVLGDTTTSLNSANGSLDLMADYTWTLSDFLRKLIDDLVITDQEIDDFFNNIDRNIDKVFNPSRYNKIKTGVDIEETIITSRKVKNRRDSGSVSKNKKGVTKANNADQTNVFGSEDVTDPPVPDYTEVKNNEAELADYIRNLRTKMLVDEQQRQIAELAIWKENEEKKINDWVASEEQKNEALELLAEQHSRKLNEINKKYNLERVQKYEEIVKFLQEQELKLHGTREELLLAEETKIRNSYNDRIALAGQMARKDIEHAEMWNNKAEELRQQREDAVNQYRLEQEEEFQDQLQSIRDKYGLVTEQEKMQLELDELEQFHNDKLISERDYRDAKYNIIKGYNDKERSDAEKLEQEKLALRIQNVESSMQIVSALGDFMSAIKEKELTEAGDNEDAKIEIRKKYADFELAINMSQIIASTAVAVAKTIAELGGVGAITPPGAALIAATSAAGLSQLGIAIVQRAAIQGYEKGGIPVVREQDGKHFTATATSTRGVISKPSILVAENGPEYIVPNEGMENPEIMNFLMMIEASRIAGTLSRFRMPKKAVGYEDGGFTGSQTAVETNDTPNIDSQIVQELALLRIEFANFKNEIATWQKALYVDYFSFKEADAEITKLETKATIK